jgi:APA family basic amino acid/polyamine antiporter
VTFAMGRDKEIPSFFGLMHGKFAVPHTGIVVLTVLSALVGVYASTGIGPFSQVDTLTQVTLISNIGTFLLYGMTCLIVFFAFRKESAGDYHPIKHRLVPLLGLLANLGMLVGVVYLSIISGGSTATDTQVAIGFVVVFMALGGVLLFLRSRQQKVPILHSERPKPLLQAEEVVALQGEGA